MALADADVWTDATLAPNGRGNALVCQRARMLKASDRSEFLISFKETLPQNFTIEFDVVPKMCCQPHRLQQ